MNAVLRDPVSGPVDVLGIRGEGALAAPQKQPVDWAALNDSFESELVWLGVKRYRVSREDAEDCYQGVLLTVLATRPKIQSLRDYVRAAFFNRLLDLLRARANHPSADIEGTPAACVCDALAGTLARETCRVLLATLDERSRRLVTRHLVDGVSLVELAEEVGYSRKTVGKKFRRAMARMRMAAEKSQSGVGPAEWTGSWRRRER